MENINFENLFRLPTNKQKDFYYHEGIRSKEYYNAFADEIAKLNEMKSNEMYNVIIINIDLPQLNGTEKQIKYANDLRIAALQDISDDFTKKSRALSIELKQTLIQQTNQSGMESRTISDVVNHAIKQNPTFKLIMNTTSAEAIIEECRHYGWKK